MSRGDFGSGGGRYQDSYGGGGYNSQSNSFFFFLLSMYPFIIYYMEPSQYKTIGWKCRLLAGDPTSNSISYILTK